MPKTATKQHIQNPEYSVYAFRHAKDIERGHTDWEKLFVTRNKYRALRRAEQFHNSADYKSIEVKRKSYDNRYSRPIDRTIKVLQGRKPQFFSTKRLLKLPKFLKILRLSLN